MKALWTHKLRTVTALAATAMLVKYTFADIDHVSYWAGKVGDLLNGLAAIIAGTYAVNKK